MGKGQRQVTEELLGLASVLSHFPIQSLGAGGEVYCTLAADGMGAGASGTVGCPHGTGSGSLEALR